MSKGLFDLPIAKGSERIMTDDDRAWFKKAQELVDREPLVEEVIAARLAETAAGESGDPDAAFEASQRLERALDKLAGWRP